MFTEKQLREFSGLLHDLTILKYHEIRIEDAEADIDRRNALILANELFGLKVADVSDKSPKYKSKGEIVAMMLRKLHWG